MINLNKKLSQAQFIIFISVLFISGLIFILGSYYFLNSRLFNSSSGFSKGPITTLPKTLRIDLDQPGENDLIFNPQVIISGKTGPNLDVLIMNLESDFVIKSDSTGKFSTVLELKIGPNKITAVVFDTHGDSRSVERNVYYSKDKI